MMAKPRSLILCAEHAGVTALYLDNHMWLRRWLAYRLQPAAACVAEDLAQYDFLRILSSRNRFPIDSIRDPRAYLTRVAHCILVSWWRRQSLELAWLEALALLPEPQHPSPEEQSLIIETLHEIDGVLDRLRKPVRQAFLMATLDGMKQKDIARALGIALPTVKKYIHDAYLMCLSQMHDE